MAKAKTKHTIPSVMDPATLPPRYTLIVKGDCMAPELPDGTRIEASSERPVRGDLTVIWLRPECLRSGVVQAQIKRLVLPPDRALTFPHRDHPESEAIPVIQVEANNPRQRFLIRCANILALHKCVGPVQVRQTRLIDQRATAGASDLFLDPDVSTVTGKRNDRLNAKIGALPFVRNPKRGEKDGRCFWSVTPSGDYATDYEQGRAWAALVLPFLEYHVGALLLSWIVADMIAAAEKNGLVLGFVREIGATIGKVRAGLSVTMN